MVSGVESGNAIVEFVFVALIALVPMVYLIAAVAVVDNSKEVVAQAARDAGRAFATAESTRLGRLRAETAVRLDFANQGIADDGELRFVAAGASCSGQALAPVLAPGARYRVCVTRKTRVPAVPSILSAGGITTLGSYELFVDDFRTVAPS
ncbi:hypothetical protein SAMN05444157_2448 [Frankineae bacterium MT45]|nr:hypothetical protein SAMN05444157_2448 [Frankineae bacterium MT45]